MSTKVRQWTILTMLFLWGLVSFLFLISEETPGTPIPIGKFIIFKGLALASLVSCVLVGRWLHRKGILPDVKEV